MVTTNLAFRDWNTVFPNATSIATLLDKLTHHADVTMIEGDITRTRRRQTQALRQSENPASWRALTISDPPLARETRLRRG